MDIVVPVYNSAHLLRWCLASLDADEAAGATPKGTTFLVLDGCDSHTRRMAEAWCTEKPAREAVVFERNRGFVGACNAGLERSTEDVAVLLNSDTSVAPGWRDRVLACFDADPAIGIASPISNFAPHNVIPMPPGLDYLEMADLVARLSDRAYPDITTPEGFCFAISRRCRETVGGLDPVFGRGYCEESDLSMRANHAGFRTVCVDDCYVFHKGRGSFGDALRDAQYNKNKAIFFGRWGARYKVDFAAFEEAAPLSGLRARIAAIHPPGLQGVRWV